MQKIKSKKSKHLVMIALALLVVAFLAYALPPYLSLVPSKSRIPIPEHSTLYYPILLFHIALGTVALLTCCLQIWPWLRLQYPHIHRLSGKIYVFAVLPSGLAGLYVACHIPFGLVGGISNIMLDLLWITFTLVGFRMIRKKNIEGHQRWMIRSFALTLSIILNRIFLIPIVILAITLEVPESTIPSTVAGVVTWLSWTTALLLAEWYLERKYHYIRNS